MIRDSVTPDRSREAATKLRANSRFHPGLFLPRGKSRYTTPRGSCCSSSFARFLRGIRTSIGSQPLEGRDRSHTYRNLVGSSSFRLFDKAFVKRASTSVDVPSDSFK